MHVLILFWFWFLLLFPLFLLYWSQLKFLFFSFLGHKTQNSIFCLHLLTALHWLTDPFLFFFCRLFGFFFCCFFQYLIPVCWPLPWTPPLLFCLCLCLMQCSCCGKPRERDVVRNVRLVSGVWTVAGRFLGGGVACVTTRGGFWVVHDDCLTPCVVSFMYQSSLI